MRKRFKQPAVLAGPGSHPGLRSGLLAALVLTSIVAALASISDGVTAAPGPSGGPHVWVGTRAAVSGRAHSGAGGAVAGSAQAGSRAGVAATTPLEGIFENCPLDTAMPLCTQRLTVMRAGGIKVVVVPGWGASLTSLAEYAAAARALGMSVMWELSNPGWWQEPPTSTDMAGYFPAFATGCGCNQNGPLLSYMIGWLGALPGTYGYYAADDSMLSPGDRAGVAAYVSQIKQSDPWHTVLIGSFGLGQSQEYEGIADMIGTEIYPVTTTSLLPVSAHRGAWSSVAQTASRAQQAAGDAHKQSAFILQAFTWGDNIADGTAVGACSQGESQLACYAELQYPSPGGQLELRNEILLHAHPKLILWWSFPGTYGQAGDDTYSIYPTGAEAGLRWAGLSAAITAPMPRPAVSPQARRARRARASLPPLTAQEHLKREKRPQRPAALPGAGGMLGEERIDGLASEVAANASAGRREHVVHVAA